MRDFLISTAVFLMILSIGYIALKPGMTSAGGSGDVISVGEGGFSSAVLANDKPVLVDFSADWCTACKKLEPTLSRLASDFKGQATVVRVDVDDSKVLADQYGVSALPTIILFKNGAELARFRGAQSERRLRGALKGAL